MNRVDQVDEPTEVDRVLAMARVLARLGRTERAIAQYDAALLARPGSEDAFVELVALLERADDWSGIARRCRAWLDELPEHSAHRYSDRVHNLYIEALCRSEGIDAAFAAYGLEQLTPGPVVLADDEILGVVVLRNENLRLPAFVDHLRRLGVDRLLCIDNGSDDGSTEWLLSQPDTVVWQTWESYRGANCGAAWSDVVLRRHVTGQWCVLVDADEWFIFPDYESRSLRDLCGDLDRQGATAYSAIMLDMYGPGRLSEARYRRGQDPLEVFPHFDGAWYRYRMPFKGPRGNITCYWGGVRARVFGGGLGGYILQKFPLFRYVPGEPILSGQHWLDRPLGDFASGRGALLHCKLDATFATAAVEEAARMEHAGRAGAYQFYAHSLRVRPDPVFYDPVHSLTFEGSRALVDLGVMRDGAERTRGPERLPALAPAIPPVPPQDAPVERPHWSVVVLGGTDRPDTGTRVADVLRALATEPASEVVVVVPTPDAERAPALAALAGGTGHAVSVVAGGQFLTDVEALNFGLARSSGVWVHVLAGDAGGDPGFYRAMRDALATSGGTVAVDADDPLRPLELDLWFPPGRLVVRRDRFEAIGGFCVTAPTAAAWELLQRLAVSERVLAVPDAGAPLRTGPLAPFGYGDELAHCLTAVDLARVALGLDDRDVEALHDRCVGFAIDLLHADIEQDRFRSALATAAEAMRIPASDAVRARLVGELSGYLP